MNERRNYNYTFSNEKDIVNFFVSYLAKEEIKKVLTDLHHNFKVRKESTDEETKLQFLKKAELELLRIVRERKVSEE
jgi:hypothetical protein